MNYIQEKFFLGITILTSSFIAWLGAIFTEGETRWIFITFAASVLQAGFLSLYFKTVSENIKMVIGRSGLSIAGGVLFTGFVAKKLNIDVTTDGITLAGMAAMTCTATFILGVGMLKLISNRSESILNRLFNKWFPPEGP